MTSVGVCRGWGVLGAIATAAASCGHQDVIISAGVKGVMCPRSGLLARLWSSKRIE